MIALLSWSMQPHLSCVDTMYMIVISRSFLFFFPSGSLLLLLQLRFKTVMTDILCRHLELTVTPNYPNVYNIIWSGWKRKERMEEANCNIIPHRENSFTRLQGAIFIFAFTTLGFYCLQVSELHLYFPYLYNCLQLLQTALWIFITVEPH